MKVYCVVKASRQYLGKESKQNQVLETGSFCYCRGLSMLEGLSCAEPNCFLFHKCCCKILKPYWQTNYSCFQTKFCLSSKEWLCPCRWEQRDLTLSSSDPLDFRWNFTECVFWYYHHQGLELLQCRGNTFVCTWVIKGLKWVEVCGVTSLQVEFFHVLLCMKHSPVCQHLDCVVLYLLCRVLDTALFRTAHWNHWALFLTAPE